MDKFIPRGALDKYMDNLCLSTSSLYSVYNHPPYNETVNNVLLNENRYPEH